MITKSLAVAPQNCFAQLHERLQKYPDQTAWLMYCRPGFEADCLQEAQRAARAQKPVLAQPYAVQDNSGFALLAVEQHQVRYDELIFARQLLRVHRVLCPLPERDRLTPIVQAIAALSENFGELFLEVPDTNDGKTLSAFTRRFQPLLEAALLELGKLPNPAASKEAGDNKAANYRNYHLPRLHLFFPDTNTVVIASSDPYNSSAALMGIHRQNMPAEAPSRSTLKLAEAIDVFMDKAAQTRMLRSGMTAVDLGAAPGGWTWQMVKRGIRVTAVDNGPMKGVLAGHKLVTHLRQDGFKFQPAKNVDWLICDMIEKPAKVASLMETWFVSGWCKQLIFNLKLPMKQRLSAVDSALGGIRKRLEEEGINYRLSAKQLYHDREEITVFLTKTK